MKRFLICILTALLSVTVFSSIGIAQQSDDNEQTQIAEPQTIEQPQIPTITDTMSEEDANKLIDNYNTQVNEYNKKIEQENENRQAEYDKQIKEIDDYNQKEKEKVLKNQKELEAQEKREQRIIEDTKSKLPQSTNIFNDLPTSWIVNTTNPITIGVSPVTSSKKYKVINLHIYEKENSSDTYIGSDVSDDSFQINMNPQDFLFAEWETIEVGEKDIVNVDCESALYPHAGAAFRRYFSGYVNGHWTPTQEFVSTAKDVNDNWNEGGPSTSFSYANGTVDNLPPANVFNVFVYNFTRYGEEFAPVTPYEPTYKEYPDKPTMLTPLTKLDHIQKSNHSSEDNKKEEPKKEESKKEETVPVVEEKTSNKKQNKNKKQDNTTKQNTTIQNKEPQLYEQWVQENRNNNSKPARIDKTLPTTADDWFIQNNVITILLVCSLLAVAFDIFVVKRKD